LTSRELYRSTFGFCTLPREGQRLRSLYSFLRLLSRAPSSSLTRILPLFLYSGRVPSAPLAGFLISFLVLLATSPALLPSIRGFRCSFLDAFYRDDRLVFDKGVVGDGWVCPGPSPSPIQLFYHCRPPLCTGVPSLRCSCPHQNLLNPAPFPCAWRNFFNDGLPLLPAGALTVWANPLLLLFSR